MKIKIESTGFELTPAIREYVENKVGLLEKLFQRFEAKGEVTVAVEIGRSTKHHKHGDVFYAEINIDLPGKVIRAEESEMDLRAAVDLAKDKIKQEVLRYKEKEVEKNKNR